MSGAGSTHSYHDSHDSDGDSNYSDEPVPTYKSSSNRRKSVFAEAYNPEDDDGDDTKVVNPKTDEQRSRVQDMALKCFMFRTLDDSQLADVIDAMFEQKVEAGEYLIKQGDDGDYFYIIETGRYSAIINTDEGPKTVMEYNNEGNFGELALLYNMPRAASVKAETDGSLWAMDRQTFRKIVLKAAFQKRKMYESFLENVRLLESLEKYERKISLMPWFPSHTMQEKRSSIRVTEQMECTLLSQELWSFSRVLMVWRKRLMSFIKGTCSEN